MKVWKFQDGFRWILLYIFIPLLERELPDLKIAYNAHKIRKQKGKLRPDGIPDDMYYFPERFGKYVMHGPRMKKARV